MWWIICRFCWLDKNQEKPAINSISKKDNKCSEYAIIAALNYEEIGKNTRRITKNKPFVNECKWEGINFPSG